MTHSFKNLKLIILIVITCGIVFSFLFLDFKNTDCADAQCVHYPIDVQTGPVPFPSAVDNQCQGDTNDLRTLRATCPTGTLRVGCFGSEGDMERDANDLAWQILPDSTNGCIAYYQTARCSDPNNTDWQYAHQVLYAYCMTFS